jgi:hypothetical protein
MEYGDQETLSIACLYIKGIDVALEVQDSQEYAS